MSRLFIALFLLTTQLHAQLLPKEGSKLHYRLTGFSSSANKQNGTYKLEVAAGYYNSIDSFKKNIVATQEGKTNQMIAEVPAFGAEYTWRITGEAGSGTSALHHFSTMTISFVDTNQTRLRITQPAKKYKDAYVFHDGARALYDMNGRPVWYLPNIEGIMNEGTLLCDLKMTSYGTITFMLRDKRAFEINYDGEVLWRGPDNSQVSRYIHYHHELTRVAGHHYMTLSTEPLLWKRNKKDADGAYSFSGDITGPDSKDTAWKMFPFGTLVEYDENGNIVWQWKTAKYVQESDLKYYAPKNGMNGFDVHVNAFFFDEKEKMVYLSFRDIHRVIKIKYPEGTVLNTYGEIYKPGSSITGKGLFCGQHSCRRSNKGLLYLYNNNVCSGDSALPKIVMMREPVTPGDELKKVWEFECPIDGIKERRFMTSGFTSGGNVTEMPDESLFVSMSSPYGKLFIVNQDKEVLWSAVSEQWSRYTRKWEILQLYRASIINTRSELEQLIRNSSK